MVAGGIGLECKGTDRHTQLPGGVGSERFVTDGRVISACRVLTKRVIAQEHVERDVASQLQPARACGESVKLARASATKRSRV